MADLGRKEWSSLGEAGGVGKPEGGRAGAQGPNDFIQTENVPTSIETANILIEACVQYDALPDLHFFLVLWNCNYSSAIPLATPSFSNMSRQT
jgi:hypothetical protein